MPRCHTPFWPKGIPMAFGTAIDEGRAATRLRDLSIPKFLGAGGVIVADGSAACFSHRLAAGLLIAEVTITLSIAVMWTIARVVLDCRRQKDLQRHQALHEDIVRAALEKCTTSEEVTELLWALASTHPAHLGDRIVWVTSDQPESVDNHSRLARMKKLLHRRCGDQQRRSASEPVPPP
jgi:hypothetical protein